MRGIMRSAIAFIFLILFVNRSPAPVVESETPTPAPESHAAASPKKATIKRKASEPKTAATTPSPARSAAKPTFAGTWTGPLGGASKGAIVTVVVSPAQDSATIKGLPIFSDRGGRAKVEGNTLSWNFMAETWNMVLSEDGKTVTIIGHHWPGGSSTGTLRRVQ